MITKTCKEIIKAARWLGHVQNSDFSDFEISTGLLNDEYLQLYKEISETGNFYSSYVDFTGSEYELPNDCYRVLGVYRKYDEKHLEPLSPSSSKQFIDGTYKIENNVVKIINETGNHSYSIKYSVVPITLTAPDDDEEMNFGSATVTIDNATWLGMNDDYVSFVVNGNASTYSFKKKSVVTGVSPVSKSNYYLGGSVSFSSGTVTFTDRDGNTTDITEDLKVNSALEIESIVVSDPYIFVNYTDNHIAIFDGDSVTEWTHLECKGKTTLGKIVAAWTNSETGRGVVFYNYYDSTFYYSSFVPDTILSYPNNEFYSLLEYRLGALLASMVGLENNYLVAEKLPQVEQQFYDTLRKDSVPATRINNVVRGIRVW